MRMRPISALVCAGIVVLGTACSGNDAKTADVSGDFLRSCGPAPGITVPLSGTVELESSSTTLRVSVGRSGHFNVRVAPGRYHLTGTSPSIDGGQVPWRARCLPRRPTRWRQPRPGDLLHQVELEQPRPVEEVPLADRPAGFSSRRRAHRQAAVRDCDKPCCDGRPAVREPRVPRL